MRSRTIEEIEEKVKEIWGNGKDYNALTVEIGTIGKDTVVISISQMYESPGLTLQNLIDLSEFFETKNISDESFARGGCETCDYGSKHGFELYIRKDENAEES